MLQNFKADFSVNSILFKKEKEKKCFNETSLLKSRNCEPKNLVSQVEK